MEDTAHRDFKEVVEREVKREEATELRFNFDGRSISVTGRTVSPSALLSFIDDLQSVGVVFAKLVPEKAENAQED